MIGKQLVVVVKLNDDKSSSKVTEFMTIEKELDVPEEVKLAETKLVAKPKISKIAEANAATEKEEVKDDSQEDEKSDLPF